MRVAAGVEVYLGWGVPAAVVRAAGSSLRWVHTAAAGVGGSLTAELAATGAVITNSRGTHAEPMADWSVAAIGFCARGFHAAVAAQNRGEWIKDAFTDFTRRTVEFVDLNIGIIGLGGIGRAIARRCHALGMTVRGVRKNPNHRRPTGVSWVGSSREVLRLARKSDVLVLAAPLTEATRHVVDETVLRAMPEGAFVINLSRGELLDEEALLVQLDNGHLGGAVLDVFAVEPLPRKHPLWRQERVLVTPHVSAVTERFWPRETALIAENIRRYKGRRTLKNRVNPETGY